MDKLDYPDTPENTSTAAGTKSIGREIRQTQSTLVDHDVEARPSPISDEKRVEEMRIPPSPWKRQDGWTGYLGESVCTVSLVPSLVIQAFATGILDATTYLDFGVFCSNQTGNTVLLTVYIVDPTGIQLLLTAISLISFLGSAFIFGQLGHLLGIRRRLWLLSSTFIQIILLALACFFLSPSTPFGSEPVSHRNSLTDTSNDPIGYQWTIIFLFAFMSGAQVANARQSDCGEVPTAPMTSSYVDLMGDKYLFARWRHPKAGGRNRRVMYILAMIAGGLAGAGIHKAAGSWVVVLVTVGIKLIGGVMVALGKPESR